MSRITIETSYKIWDDQTGDRFEVCEDADGLGMTEIRYVNDEGKIVNKITIPDNYIPGIFACLEKKMIVKKLSYTPLNH